VINFLQINFLNHLNGLDLLQFRFKVSLHFFVLISLKSNVEIWFLWQHTFDKLSILTLKITENSHSLLVIILPVFKGFGLKVGKEAHDFSGAIVEAYSNLFLIIFSLISDFFVHSISRQYNNMLIEPNITRLSFN